MEGASNGLAVVSLICGIIAVVGHGCCCLPILSYLAILVVPLCEILSLVTGAIALATARANGQGGGMAMAGLGSGVLALLMSLAYIVLVFVMGVAFVGLSVLSEMS